MTSVKATSKLSLGIAIASIVLTVVTVLGIVIGLHNSNITKAKVKSSDYVIGTITAEGKLLESKQSLYTKDLITVDGLEIDIDEETATIQYNVAFYDKDGKFISINDEYYTEDFDVALIPETADSCRILITPYEVDSEAVTLNIFNVGKYAGQLTVRYDI